MLRHSNGKVISKLIISPVMKIVLLLLIAVCSAYNVQGNWLLTQWNGRAVNCTGFLLTVADQIYLSEVIQTVQLTVAQNFLLKGQFQENQFYLAKDSVVAGDCPTCSLDTLKMLNEAEATFQKAFYFSMDINTMTFFTPENKVIMIYQRAPPTASMSFSLVNSWKISAQNGITVNPTVALAGTGTSLTAYGVTFRYTLSGSLVGGSTITLTKSDPNNLCATTASNFCTAMGAAKLVRVFSRVHWCLYGQSNKCVIEAWDANASVL